MAIDLSVASAVRRARGIRFRYDTIGGAVLVTDILLIVAVSGACGGIYALIKGNFQNELTDSVALGLLFAALFALSGQACGLYRPLELLNPAKQVARVLLVWLGMVGFLTLIGFALKMGHTISRAATISFAMSGVACVTAMRFYWYGFLQRALAKGAFATRRVAVVGCRDLLNGTWLQRQLIPFGLSVVARVGLPDRGKLDESDIDLAITDTVSALRGSKVQEIIVALDGLELDHAHRLIAGLRILPLPLRLILDESLGDIVSRPIRRFGNLVGVEMHRAPMTLSERGVKRALDVAVAGGALLLISPLLLMTALAIRLESPGPILFRQTRNGFNNRPFKILKFRSMHVMEDGGVIRQAARDDKRVTRVGRWIRRLSIDELPQLWNVLRGEMSIVGPRPHALAHDAHYEKLIGDYPYRQHVKPGLTGWAQVNGSRGETPTIESMAERVRFDIWYVENWSFVLDVRIIARTFTTLLNVKHTY